MITEENRRTSSTELFGGALFSAGLAAVNDTRLRRTFVAALVATSGVMTPAWADDVCFSSSNIVAAGFSCPLTVHAADIDGDGDMDVLGGSYIGADVLWWENTEGDGTAWVQHIVDGNPEDTRSVWAADVDGDGDLDILGAMGFSDKVTWWENTTGDGTAWTEHTVDANFSYAQDIHAVDMDRDGDIDVIAVGGQAIAWWENTIGDGTAWMKHTVAGVGRSIYAVDIDGDGDIDIVGSTGDVRWWENTAGDGTHWAEHNIDDDFAGAYEVHAADLDGDGDVDVLCAGVTADEIAWWENELDQGRIVWTKHTLSHSFNCAISVHAADLDGDGDMDVLGAKLCQNDHIRWWENNPDDGEDWPERVVESNFVQAWSVYAADIDNDGDLDVLGTDFADDKIAWWENVTCCLTDLDGDGSVGTGDLILLLGAWGTDPGGPPDFNGDGTVKVADLIILLGDWGPCPK